MKKKKQHLLSALGAKFLQTPRETAEKDRERMRGGEKERGKRGGNNILSIRIGYYRSQL